MKPPAPGLAVVLLSNCALVLALVTAGGCSKPAAKAGERQASPGSEAVGSAGSSSETRELEEKAAGYADRFREIQESDMTADQKAQAAGELVDEQQRTIREAEDGGAGGSQADPQQ
jgi:hypothetical protein